jgi:hypothetical protein
MRRILMLLALAVLPTAAFAQEDDEDWLRNCEAQKWNRRPTACDVRVRRIEKRDLLTVRPGQNGAVQIVAEDRGDYEVHARVQGSAESPREAAELLRDVSVDYGATITTRAPSSRNDWSVSFVIFVPRNTNLDLLTRNGPVSVKNVIGKMELSATNGPIQLSGVGGDVHAVAQNGPLQVRLTGSRWEGAGLDAETHNGPVQLVIPESYNARLETGTVNGPIDTDFPINVTLDGRRSWKRFTTTLGSGGPPVRVVTTNGPLSLRRP